MIEVATVTELLATPERWTQGALARAAGGAKVFSWSHYAVRWSLLGAIRKVYGTSWYKVSQRVRQETGMDAMEYNDDPTRTHADVLALCRRLGI